MKLSQESYRTRWFILTAAWLLIAVSLYLQTSLIRDYLNLAGGIGLRGAPAPSTPLKAIFPVFAADGQTWVRHALSLAEGNGPQLRYTAIDNAPHGREVHWNSAWAWTILVAGKVNQLFTGNPLPKAVENAALWLPPLTLFALTVLLSAWATRRAGLIAGLVVAAAISCTDRVFEGFFPSYVDHHGLLTVSAFALILGAVFMGAGWWQPAPAAGLPLLPESPQVARRAAVFSALAGAFGVWVSAASAVPPIALTGAAGLLVVLVQGRAATAQGMQFDPQTWRIWGRVGGLGCLFFYLLEYFPGHMSLRLEPNHPLHALAWWGGGEFIAEFSARWLGTRENRWTQPLRLIWPLFAIAGLPVAIALGGAKVFVVIDPFLSNLHHRYIQEFLPIWATLRNFTPRAAFQLIAVDNLPLIVGIAALTYWRRQTPVIVWFATAAALLFNAMGWWQSRWLLNASGVQMTLAIVLLAAFTVSVRPLFRWIAALVMIGVLYLPTVVLRYAGSANDLRAKVVSPKDAMGPLFRDVAAALRASQPEGEITVLSSPNSSTAIGYYGRFKTLGTLYWENNAGLKAAARIFSARNADEAAKLIEEHGVTHLAMITEENFIVQYFELLNPGATADDVKACFGWQLLGEKVVPPWLQMIPYKVPDDLAALKVGVMLFKVNFRQTVPEALYNIALSQIALDTLDEAEKTLDILISQHPNICEPWIRKGEILLRRQDWVRAAEFLLKGISLAPVGDQLNLYSSVASNFYREGQPALAAQVYRHALAHQRVPGLVSYLAWILATSADDSLRNGAEALTLAEEAVRSEPSSATYLNVLAAALAENGRFPEAIAAAERALANARVTRNTQEIQTSEQNLQVLRQNKPLRK